MSRTLFDVETQNDTGVGFKTWQGRGRETEKKVLNLNDLQRQTWKHRISHFNVLFILTPGSIEGLFACATKMLLN